MSTLTFSAQNQSHDWPKTTRQPFNTGVPGTGSQANNRSTWHSAVGCILSGFARYAVGKCRQSFSHCLFPSLNWCCGVSLTLGMAVGIPKMCKRQKTDDSWRTTNAIELASTLYYKFLLKEPASLQCQHFSTVMHGADGCQWLASAVATSQGVSYILGDLSHCTIVSSSARVISMPTAANNRAPKTLVPFRIDVCDI